MTLAIEDATLNPAFSPDTKTYGIILEPSEPYEEKSYLVTATPSDEHAVVSYALTSIPIGQLYFSSFGGSNYLVVSANDPAVGVLKITVTNGYMSNTYTVNIAVG